MQTLHVILRGIQTSSLASSEGLLRASGFSSPPHWKHGGQLVQPRKAEQKRFSSTLKIERSEFIGRSGALFNPISTMTERYEFPDLCTLVVINRANITEVKKSVKVCKNNHRLNHFQRTYVHYTGLIRGVLGKLDVMRNWKITPFLSCFNRKTQLCLKVRKEVRFVTPLKDLINWELLNTEKAEIYLFHNSTDRHFWIVPDQFIDKVKWLINSLNFGGKYWPDS